MKEIARSSCAGWRMHDKVANWSHSGKSVSYTHLTLPTTDSVSIPVVAVSSQKKQAQTTMRLVRRHTECS